jgi:hypothetical protein
MYTEYGLVNIAYGKNNPLIIPKFIFEHRISKISQNTVRLNQLSRQLTVFIRVISSTKIKVLNYQAS